MLAAISVQWVAHLLLIRDILGSSLRPQTYFVAFLSAFSQIYRFCLSLDKNRFLPHHCLFIIHCRLFIPRYIDLA
jgi:hypothetical protein